MKLRDLLILVSGVAAASHAYALSLGNSQGQVVLGEPIDLVFPMQADPGNTPATSCLTADLWMGDTPLLSTAYTITPLASAVRLQTFSAVNEPLLTVKLSAGCAQRLTRSYTFFAAPPPAMLASAQPLVLDSAHAARATATPSTTGSAMVASTASRAHARARPAKRQITPSAAPWAQAATMPLVMLTHSSTEAAPAAAQGQTPAEVPLAAATSLEPQAPAVERSTPASEAPRLQLEPLDTLFAPADHSAAPDTVAASADMAAPAEAEPALSHITQELLHTNAARIEALEGQLLSLTQQLTRNLGEVSRLQTQLTAAENADLPLWVQLLLGLFALALVAIAWLLYRLRQQHTRPQDSWSHTVLAVGNSEAATLVDTDNQPPHAAEPPPQPHVDASAKHIPAAVPEAEVLTHMPHWDASELSPPSLAPATVLPLSEVLTAQAMFDVQEQAEFYASIGENDQAIAILQAHIAEHATTSPLSYIELLHLLFRLGRMDAYDTVRQQFQSHFNVRVPDFLGFARKGQDLWSAYPDALARIEALWPTDKVQDLLHSLIVRPPSSQADSPRFDLAAFDDLFMLYQMAQSTPASQRGPLPGRTRTAPRIAPLPELTPPEAADAAHAPHTGNTLLPEPPTPQADHALDTGLTLDMTDLHWQPSAAAVSSTEAGVPDMPMLSLDDLLPSAAPDRAMPPTAEAPAPSLGAHHASGPSPEALTLEQELRAFIMDERDLPPPAKPRAR